MRFFVQNFGCRATQADGAAVESQLVERGGALVAGVAEADVAVVNTCTVTASADADARNWIRRARRENPNVRLLVTGCYAQRAPGALANLPGVEWVVGNSHKSEVAKILMEESGRQGFVPLESLSTSGTAGPAVLVGDVSQLKSVLVAPVFGSSEGRSRPTLKIQDGCNQRCAYCVIPSVRGPSRSLTAEEVVAQVERLATDGYPEVVISGVDLGAWGQDLDGRPDLAELTGRLLKETSVSLLRFSSLEPMDLTDGFIDLLTSSPRIARHLHAPLQSGSDRILRRMHRWYTRGQYAERIEQVAGRWPNLGLGADVIVGFPGETDEDFEQTVELVERLPFTYLHVFSYSDRPGTEGSTLPDKVPGPVIRERSRRLRALASEKAAAFRGRQVGRTLRAVTLTAMTEGGRRDALSENYLKLRVKGNGTPLTSGSLITARVESVTDEYLLAGV